MADEGTFATTAEVQKKAGENASATANVEAYINVYIKQAESFICCFCRYNFLDAYATLNSDVQEMLKMVASDLAAIYVIQYDMSGFASRIEAEDMVNILRDSALRGLAILRDKKVQEFMINA